jgi:hypothetical protein
MKRNTAEQVIKAMHSVDLAIHDLDAAVRAIEDEAERKKMLKSIFSLVCDLHEQITLPVVREYPDLHPDRPR